ncbi:MAG: HEAT repeat domain-containing protein [Planctomycetes bacterium]|nr:HEAT repeat domain-containing protein [Planctomycetota bacterium]
MIAIALGLMALAVQNDPAVSYREGLYEEVDQGNLEKAIEHYAKALQGGADPALKARARFRQGHCHEKLGRKQDAEQAYRDVIERFPAQEETVRLARGRLAVLEGKEPAAAVPLETEVPRLILDLADRDFKKRENAIRRLTLIGESVLPDLRRASQHKDVALSMGAARVLLELEQYEGLCPVFVRAFEKKLFGDPDRQAFAELLRARPEARPHYAASLSRFSAYQLKTMATLYSGLMQDSAYSAALEDRIVAEDDSDLAKAWYCGANASHLARLIPRLTHREKPQYSKLLYLLKGTDQSLMELDDAAREALSKVLLTALAHPEVAGPFLESGPDNSLALLAYHMTPTSFLKGLVSSWLKNPNAGTRISVIEGVEELRIGGLQDFTFEILASGDTAEDVKLQILSHIGNFKLSEPQQHVLTTYYLSYLKKFASDPNANADVLYRAATYLPTRLPPDSADLDLVLNVALDHEVDAEKLDPPVQKRYFQAALRALARKETRGHALKVLQHPEAATERLKIGGFLLGMGEDPLVQKAVRLFADTVKSAASDERTRALKETGPVLKSGSRLARVRLFVELYGVRDATLNEAAKVAVHDPDEGIRYRALCHCSYLADPDAIPLLIEALKDPEPFNRQQAAYMLGAAPSAAAIPPLIDLLQSPDQEVRAAATQALTKIRAHFDKQQEWRKWYEDLKKRDQK